MAFFLYVHSPNAIELFFRKIVVATGLRLKKQRLYCVFTVIVLACISIDDVDGMATFESILRPRISHVVNHPNGYTFCIVLGILCMIATTKQFKSISEVITIPFVCPVGPFKRPHPPLVSRHN